MSEVSFFSEMEIFYPSRDRGIQFITIVPLTASQKYECAESEN